MSAVGDTTASRSAVFAIDSDARSAYRPSLDGVRALAVLSVVAFHLGGRPLMAGRLGVDVFFVLSGFLITTLLVEDFQRDTARAISRFYFRRVLRLMPALALTLVLTLVAYGGFAQGGLRERTLGWGLFGAATYTTAWFAGAARDLGGFSHTWSLSIEEHFYVAWPWIIHFLVRRSALLVGVILLYGTAATLRTGAWMLGLGPSALYNVPFFRAHELLAGALAALLVQRLGPSLSPWHGRLAVACGVMILAFAASYLWLSERLADAGPFPVVLAPGVAVILAHLWVHPGSGPSALLRHPWLIWIGRRSYGIYLLHLPIVLLVLRADDDLHRRLVVALVTLPATLLLSELSFRFIEQPILLASGSRPIRSRA